MRQLVPDVPEVAPLTQAMSRSKRLIARAARALGGWWRRDERGSAAIEFAIIAPVFFFLMFVIAETALIFIAEQVMDNAVFETARLVRTGQVQDNNMTQTDFKNAVCAGMSVFINCNSAAFYLEVKSYASFSAMQMNQPIDSSDNFIDPGTYNFGQASTIEVVRAYYQWPTHNIFGALSLSNLANGKRLIGSFAAFKNEPYSTSASN
jgi:Flp pilus assembly protein TadG